MVGKNLRPHYHKDHADFSEEEDMNDDAILLPSQTLMGYGSTDISRRPKHRRFPSFRWGSIDLTKRRKSNLCV